MHKIMTGINASHVKLTPSFRSSFKQLQQLERNYPPVSTFLDHSKSNKGC